MVTSASKVPVAILTSFTYVKHGYSLTGIVEDQVRLLSSYGHPVHLFVCSNFPDKEEQKLFENDPWTREKYTLHRVLPKASLIDYRKTEELTEDHQAIAKQTGLLLGEHLREIPIVFTHDLIFTGWHLPYAKGIQQASLDPFLRHHAWFHWVHSIPSIGLDFWNLRNYFGKHRVVFPNKTDSLLVANQFRTEPEKVLTIPHIKDYRSFWDFGKDTCDFIEEYPSVMRSDIVQIYPASTDRLSAKGVDKLLNIFKHFKKNNHRCCLVIANQWATGTQRKEDLVRYYKRIRRAGLELDKEVIFTSDWITGHDEEGKAKHKYATGIPRKMLRELFLLSNLFIYPTREESFGLVGPEATMTGMLMVYNKSLSMMWEVSGGAGLHVDFGSYQKKLDVPTSEKEYFEAIAGLILGRMMRNEAIACKSFTRIRYNWNNLYEKFYGPLIGETIIW